MILCERKYTASPISVCSLKVTENGKLETAQVIHSSIYALVTAMLN
jgi:hypothetical protein